MGGLRVVGVLCLMLPADSLQAGGIGWARGGPSLETRGRRNSVRM